jgi:hypothetical protein
VKYSCLVILVTTLQATKKLGTRFYRLQHTVSSVFPELTFQMLITPHQEGFLYIQVSNDKQKEDLEQQNQLSDISPGVNFKQPGLKTLL